MDDKNIRFKELRRLCGKSQEQWGKLLGMTKSGVSDIENGRNRVSERHLAMLSNWTGAAINIDWLRTGEGEPFRKIDHEAELTEFLSDVLKSEKGSFKRRFVLMLANLNEEEWKLLEHMVSLLAVKKD